MCDDLLPDLPDAPGFDIGAGFPVGRLLIGAGLAAATLVAALTPVTVPLLLPVATTAGCLWFVADKIRGTWGQPSTRRHRTCHGHPHAHARPGDGRLLRIGTADREHASRSLQQAYATGHLLSNPELEARLEAVLGARTRGDLDTALQDLPPTRSEGTS